MRNLFLALLLLCGSAYGLDADLPLVSVQARGFVIHDNTDTVYFEQLFDKQTDGQTYVVGAVQKLGRRETTMHFKPETAQQIAHETEPYITLFRRGRKFSEEIRINPSIVIQLTSKSGMQLTIRNTAEKGVLQYRGDKLFQLIQGWLNAVEISETWLQRKLGSVIPTAVLPSADAAWTQAAPAGPVFVLGIDEIAADYAANEYAAEAKYGKYLNQSVAVAGTVKAVTRDSFTNYPKVLFSSAIGSLPVICLLEDATEDEVAAIAPGQFITVEGIWLGKTEDDEYAVVQGRIAD